MKLELNDVISKYIASTYENYQLIPSWTNPEPQYGDLSTNVAMVHSKQLGQNPRELADNIVEMLNQSGINNLEKAEVAGPGFINVHFSDAYFLETLKHMQNDNYGSIDIYKDKQVVAEFSDPNPFKSLHVGHLYTSFVGDVLSRLVENAGGSVTRVNFGGDVGLHVAKAMLAIREELGGFDIEKLKVVPKSERAQWLSDRYVEGSQAYESNENAKNDIAELNRAIYQLHASENNDDLSVVYWEARRWSYEYFDEFYERINVHFDKYMPESENADLGVELIKQHIGDVYEEDEGAVVFRGEQYDLHTRVFITSEGLPTYEAKDVGLAKAKWDTYKFDESIIITGNDIVEYMKVVKKSMEPYLPEAVERTRHLTHGNVLIRGVGKMSSRTGNVLKAEEVIDNTKQIIEHSDEQTREKIMLGALRYSFLKQRLGDDIQFDISDSVKTTGNSGPYLQYAYVRAKSILDEVSGADEVDVEYGLEDSERQLVRMMDQFLDVVIDSTKALEPHKLCTYLHEVSQEYNRFYEQNKVLGSTRESIRLNIVRAYANVMKAGLNLLGIPVLKRM